jgi:hypothetical protein
MPNQARVFARAAFWALAGSLAIFGLQKALPHARNPATDFHIFYEASAAWLRGESAYALRVEATQNLNHPLLLAVLAPLTRLPLSIAFLIWLGIALSLLLICAGPIARHTGAARLGIATILLSLSGTAIGLALGQVTFILLALFTLAWTAHHRGRLRSAGLWLGLLAALKPFFALFLLYFVVRRSWRAASGFLMSFTASMVAGVLLVGSSEFFTWLDYLRSVDRHDNLLSGGVWGFGDRLFMRYDVHYAASFTPLFEAPVLARLVDWSLAAGVVGVLSASLLRHRRHDIDRDYALVGLASLLLSPLGWIYYQPILAGPVFASSIRYPRARWLIWALAAIPYTWLVQRIYGPLGTALAGCWCIGILGSAFALTAVAAEPDAGGRTAPASLNRSGQLRSPEMDVLSRVGTARNPLAPVDPPAVPDS